MSKIVWVNHLEDIQWPARCAQCGDKENLTLVGASSGRIKSVSPSLTGAATVTSEMLDLSYPVCEKHAKGVALANLMTRNTTGLRLLRGMIYFIGPLGILYLLILPINLFVRHNTPGAPLAFTAIYVLAAAALVYLVRAFRKLPVRIVKHTAEGAKLRFANDLYAQYFRKLNLNIVGDR